MPFVVNHRRSKVTTHADLEPHHQEYLRREKQRQAADLIKSWLDLPDLDEERRYEMLECELNDISVRP